MIKHHLKNTKFLFLVSLTALSFFVKSQTLPNTQLFINKLNSIKQVNLQFKLVDSTLLKKNNHLYNVAYLNEVKNATNLQNQNIIKAYMYLIIGYNDYENGDYDSAKVYLKKSVLLNSEVNNDSIVGLCYYRLGFAEYTNGQYDLAAAYYLDAIKYFTKTNNKTKLSWVYNSLGLNFQVMPNPNYQKAIFFYNKSINILPNAFTKNLGYAYLRLGTVYGMLNRYNESVRYFDSALKVADSIKSSSVKFWAITNSINTFIKKDLKKAESYGIDAINMSKNGEFGKPAIVNTNYYYAKVKAKLYQFDSAIYYSNKSLNFCFKNGIAQFLPENYLILSEIYEQKNDVSNALIYHKKYILIKDSIFDFQRNNTIVEMEARFDLKEKENEIGYLMNQKTADRKIKIILIAVIILILFIVVLAIFAIVKIRKAKKLLDIKTAEIEHKQKEIIDSIYYAKRIQDSLLPTKMYINKKINKEK